MDNKTIDMIVGTTMENIDLPHGMIFGEDHAATVMLRDMYAPDFEDVVRKYMEGTHDPHTIATELAQLHEEAAMGVYEELSGQFGL